MKSSYVLVVVVLFCGNALAGGATKMSHTMEVANKDVGGTTGMTIHDGLVVKPKMVISKGSYYAKGVASISPNGHEDLGDGIDITPLGWTKSFLDETVSVDVGYSYYNITPLRNTTGDLHAIYASADFLMDNTVRPFVDLEMAFGKDPDVLEGGFVYKFGLHVGPLAFSAGGHDGAYGFDSKHISFKRLGISKDVKVGGVS